jgi:radical SAM superfamily enzyme YgiQ (UPF0313 family)
MYHCLLFNVSQESTVGRSAGVYRIAHILRENNWDVEVIDFAKYWSLQELQSLAKSRINSNTKFFGFSHMFSIWTETLECFCVWLKREYPDLIFISGSSVSPVFKTQIIDYYISGFGENAILVLLKYLFSNGPRPKFHILPVNGARIIFANERYPAFPMRSLMIKYEDRDFIQSNEWLGIEFSRGCKFSCDFCNFPVLGVKGDYTRDAEDFYVHVNEVHDKFGVKAYCVADETFNDSTEKITKFADVVQKLSFLPTFTGFLRADLLVSRAADKEELLKMNFIGHYYGIESFNTRSAKAVGKGMPGERLQQGLIDIKNYFQNNGTKNFRGDISLIFGLPYETIDTILESHKWILENWSDQSINYYPLEIPIGDFAKKSKMSVDWEKYGYTQLENTDNIADHILSYDQYGVMMHSELLNWKNEFMDFSQAKKLFVDLIPDIMNLRISAWTLSGNNLPDSLKERMAITNADWMKFKDDRTFIDSYIQKKLNFS